MAVALMPLEGRVSLLSFLLGLSVLLLALLPGLEPLLAGTPGRVALALYVAGLNGLLLLLYKECLYQVAVRACFLGFAFGCGLLISFTNSSWKHFGCTMTCTYSIGGLRIMLLVDLEKFPHELRYICSLSFFHYSEYLITAITNPKSLSLDSFLLNHSLEYTLAAVSSWMEFTVEKFIYPDMKQITWLAQIGLMMVVIGECLRKAAMLTAGSNFNHIVQNEKSNTHILVTSGVYSWSRHPSYVGWFYWSIGTQVLLCNPICIVGYTVASWRFFRERIEEEEFTLIHFFGDQYLDYKRKVPTGLPFIKGLKVEP